jgi:mycothiol synthase
MLEVDMHDYGSPAGEEGDIRDDWVLPDVDLSRDTSLVVSKDGTPVGYALVLLEGEGEMEAMGFVHPEHRGRGIGAALLRRLETRAGEMAGDGGTIRAWTTPTEDTASLFASRGWRLARSMMRMDAAIDGPVELTDPSGVEIRLFEPGRDDRPVHSAMMEAFVGHYGFVPKSFEEWLAVWRTPDVMPKHWFVAQDGEEVVGAVLGVLRLDIGWIADLGVRRAWRGRGVGEALVHRAMESFRERGFTSVGLNVDPQNETGAMRLYERLGFRFDKRFDFYEKDV